MKIIRIKATNAYISQDALHYFRDWSLSGVAGVPF